MLRVEGMTPRQAAQRLGIGLHRLYELIWEGRVSAQRVDGRWLLDKKAVEQRLKEREAQRAPNGDEQGEVRA